MSKASIVAEQGACTAAEHSRVVLLQLHKGKGNNRKQELRERSYPSGMHQRVRGLDRNSQAW